MLNVKKLLTKITNALNGRYVVQSHSTPSYSMSANGAHTVSMSISKSGYFPIGVVGLATSGSYSGYAVATSFYIDNRVSGSATAHAYITNRSANASTWKTSFTVLWEREL